jgi:large subunit ribosomal protein L23
MKDYNSRIDILRKPLVTEKTTIQAASGKYSFQVADYANKIEIKKAVENTFDVSVVKGKTKKRGNKVSKKPNWKKAIVTLKPGDEINIFEGI